MLSLSAIPHFIRLDNRRVREGRLPSQRAAFMGTTLPASQRHVDSPRRNAFDFSTVSDVPCFVKASRIRTPHAEVPVETLKVGDLVCTHDSGPQTIRWIGTSEAAEVSRAAPVEFDIGAFGNPVAARVSPDHRILLSGWRCKKIVGADQVFARAIDLVNGRDVNQLAKGKVTYYHIALEQHEVICADGIWSESFHPDTVTPTKLSGGGFDMLSTIFPAVAAETASYGPHARADINPFEARLIRP